MLMKKIKIAETLEFQRFSCWSRWRHSKPCNTFYRADLKIALKGEMKGKIKKEES